MLTATIKVTNQKVFACDVGKSEAPFECPMCKQDVCLKKGDIYQHHFAHYPPITCNWGAGESREHMECKREIYEELKLSNRVSKLEMERNLGTVRPDVSCYIGKSPVAIEVQISRLDIATITHRTREYAKKGIYVLWLSPFDDKVKTGTITVSAWQKWMHSLYFGQVFYWRTGDWVAAYKLQTAQTYVEATDWGGGYMKDLKRKKNPRFLRGGCIAENFVPRTRQEWRSKNFTVPACKIWTLTEE